MSSKPIDWEDYQQLSDGSRWESYVRQNAEIKRLQAIVDELREVLDIPATADTWENLRNWVNDLQSGMYINCVYCGHRYGPREDTPVAMADVLREHIEHCPEHPLSEANAEIKRLRAVHEAAKSACAINTRDMLCRCVDGYCSLCRLRDAITDAESAGGK